MKSYGGLFRMITSEENFRLALRKALHRKEASQEQRRFIENADELHCLIDELENGHYRPRGYRQFRIMDPKPRVISCAPFRDRVAQHALCNVIGPLMERRFIFNTYACRKGKGTHRAIMRAQQLTRRYRYFCKVDVSKFFDNVDHDILYRIIERMFREKRLLDVLGSIIRCPYPLQLPGRGLPIGNLTSQWFANLYLDGADYMLTDENGVPGYIRYMDDMLIFCDSKDLLWGYTILLMDWLKYERKLEIKRKALVLSECRLGVPFLGCRIFPWVIRLQHSNYHRMLRLIRRKEGEYGRGEIDEIHMASSVRSSVSNARYFGLSVHTSTWASY